MEQVTTTQAEPAPGADAMRSERLAHTTGKMLLSQTRTGTLTAMVAAALLGLMLVPAVGALRYGAWLAGLCALYALRDLLVMRASRRGEIAGIVRITAYSSAVLGLVISAPAPLFFPLMSDATRALFTAVNASWVSMAATVIGVHPPSYHLYLALSFGMLALGWWLSAGLADALMITLLLCLGAYVLARFSLRLRGTFEESSDIRHDKQRLAEELGVAVAHKEAAERERSRLLAAASHDLLQPIHALLLLTGLLSRDPARRDELVDHIKATAGSIEGMFRGLMDQARIDAGKLVARSEPVQLLTLVRAVQGGAQARAAQGRVALNVSVQADQWALGDPALIERVLRNLVDNALKFTRQGEVAVTCTSEPQQVRIEVRDTGIGVDAPDLAQLCQPFFRGQAARDAETDGIGLGLANAARMVQLMAGQIEIASTRAEGTRVRVTLPRWRGPTQAPAVAPDSTAGVRFERVIVIDDDRSAREAIALWLSCAGCEVLQAPHYGAAMAACEARDFQPDLLLVDYRLSGTLDGLHVIARLRQRFGPVEAMLITGEPLDETTLPGDVVLLRKPLRPERLEALLSRRTPALS